MAPLLAPLLLFLLFTTSFPKEIDIVPKPEFVLGKKVPDVTLINERGEEVRLSQVADGKPLMLSFIYTRCTSACPMIVKGIKEALKGITYRDVKVLLIDFDERDKPADLRNFRKKRDIIGSRWIVALAKGNDLKNLTRAVDFRFFYDEKTDMFAHPNVLVILSPDLIISGYMMGVTYNSKKLSLLIEKARLGKVDLNPVKGFFLKCFRYDPVTGTYTIDWSFVAMLVGGLIPILGMFYFLFLRDLLLKLRGVGS